MTLLLYLLPLLLYLTLSLSPSINSSQSPPPASLPLCIFLCLFLPFSRFLSPILPPLPHHSEAGCHVVVVVRWVPTGRKTTVLLLRQPYPLTHTVRDEGESEYSGPGHRQTYIRPVTVIDKQIQIRLGQTDIWPVLGHRQTDLRRINIRS